MTLALQLTGGFLALETISLICITVTTAQILGRLAR